MIHSCSNRGLSETNGIMRYLFTTNLQYAFNSMSTIKCVLFDLDGVLFDGKSWHEEAFLMSLKEIYPIPEVNKHYHHQHLDGLSTRQKLKHLTEKFKLPTELYDSIFRAKQEYTEKLLHEKLRPNLTLQHMFQTIKRSNVRILCVSNSIYKTTQIALSKLGILYFFDGILSNEDATDPKPSPELYLRAFLREKVAPHNVLIVEDSFYGRTAAYASGAHVLPVVDTIDNTLSKIELAIERVKIQQETEIYEQPVNIVIPMAGHGSRFVKAGFKEPKPFIPVFGKPMIEYVIRNMMPKQEIYAHKHLKCIIKPRFHFVAQKAHLQDFSLEDICKRMQLDYTITTVDKVTEGSACTILLTEQHIDSDVPLVTANSDQWLDWDSTEYYRSLLNPSYDGCISVFYQTNLSDMKWSYSELHDSIPTVKRVAEKEVISCWATTGVYGWKRGSDYVKYAKQMVAKDIRVNGEFYTCPVYNEAIQDGKKIRNMECRKLWGLGVPEDLEIFHEQFPKCHPSLI